MPEVNFQETSIRNTLVADIVNDTSSPEKSFYGTFIPLANIPEGVVVIWVSEGNTEELCGTFFASKLNEAIDEFDSPDTHKRFNTVEELFADLEQEEL